MNALNNIQAKAIHLVDELANIQINNMKSEWDGLWGWINEGNGVIDRFSGKFSLFDSIRKYLYDVKYITSNGKEEFSMSNWRKVLSWNKYLAYQQDQLLTMSRPLWEQKYRKDYILTQTKKLNKALAKHLNNDMTATNIMVDVGLAGAEVTATIDKTHIFRTSATLCGGDIQCLHYRYYSKMK
jgi:hypothetical protein